MNELHLYVCTLNEEKFEGKENIFEYQIGIFWLHWFLSKDYFLHFKLKSKVIVALLCSLLWIRLIDCLISMFFLTCPSLSGAPMTPICNFSQGLGSFTPPRDNFPQELVFFQGNLLRGIDNCLGRTRSVVQGPKRSPGQQISTSDFDPQGVSKIYKIKTLCHYEIKNQLLYQKNTLFMNLLQF